MIKKVIEKSFGKCAICGKIHDIDIKKNLNKKDKFYKSYYTCKKFSHKIRAYTLCEFAYTNFDFIVGRYDNLPKCTLENLEHKKKELRERDWCSL